MGADHVAIGIPSGEIVVHAGWMWKGAVADVVPRRIKKVQCTCCCILSIPRTKQCDGIFGLKAAYRESADRSNNLQASLQNQ